MEAIDKFLERLDREYDARLANREEALMQHKQALAQRWKDVTCDLGLPPEAQEAPVGMRTDLDHLGLWFSVRDFERLLLKLEDLAKKQEASQQNHPQQMTLF